MRPIPLKLRLELAADPYYKVCARFNAVCEGRITWEHSWIYAGKQINEKWAIIPLCHYHHQGGGLDKDKNRYIALLRATAEELAKYPRRKWDQELNFLKKKYE